MSEVKAFVTMAWQLSGDGLSTMPKHRTLGERVAERIAEGGEDVARDVIEMVCDYHDGDRY